MRGRWRSGPTGIVFVGSLRRRQGVRGRRPRRRPHRGPASRDRARPEHAERCRRSATARSTSPRSTASCGSATSPAISAASEARRSSPTPIPTDDITAGSSSRFGPDGRLYVPVGAPCNVCEPPGPLYATITRIDVGGRPARDRRAGRAQQRRLRLPSRDRRAVVHRQWPGLARRRPAARRAESAARSPASTSAFRTATATGMRDPEYNARSRVRPSSRRPARELGPHVAALGMRFYTGRMFPETYRTADLHRRARLLEPLDPDRLPRDVREDRRRAAARPTSRSPRAGSTAVSPAGRPADVLVMPDGALLVSDDKAGRIYRITYTAP